MMFILFQKQINNSFLKIQMEDRARAERILAQRMEERRQMPPLDLTLIANVPKGHWVCYVGSRFVASDESRQELVGKVRDLLDNERIPGHLTIFRAGYYPSPPLHIS
jgi:hypothetical protein